MPSRFHAPNLSLAHLSEAGTFPMTPQPPVKIPKAPLLRAVIGLQPTPPPLAPHNSFGFLLPAPCRAPSCPVPGLGLSLHLHFPPLGPSLGADSRRACVPTTPRLVREPRRPVGLLRPVHQTPPPAGPASTQNGAHPEQNFGSSPRKNQSPHHKWRQVHPSNASFLPPPSHTPIQSITTSCWVCPQLYLASDGSPPSLPPPQSEPLSCVAWISVLFPWPNAGFHPCPLEPITKRAARMTLLRQKPDHVAP